MSFSPADFYNLRRAFEDGPSSLLYEIETLFERCGDKNYRATVALIAASGDKEYQRAALNAVSQLTRWPNNSFMSHTLLTLFVSESDTPDVAVPVLSVGIDTSKVAQDARAILEEGWDTFEVHMVYHLITLTLKRFERSNSVS